MSQVRNTILSKSLAVMTRKTKIEQSEQNGDILRKCVGSQTSTTSMNETKKNDTINEVEENNSEVAFAEFTSTKR